MQPKIYHASEYDIDHSLIDPDALTVLNRLSQAGFTAYLVGGSVRDLLIKKSPKDVDISTSALPEQIKRVFGRQCILIGKRFRLAHVRFGHKIIEVSTFRSGDNEGDLILQDNQWGTPEQDVLRRDFTINGLFYNPFDHSIIDYVGGWKDIHEGILRTIGDPTIRFKQDPVRMLRLLKFYARFGFQIDQESEEALTACLEEIKKSSPARVLEEIFRMLESCASAPFFKTLKETGMLALLFPTLNERFSGKEMGAILKYLEAVDQVNKQSVRYPVERSVLCSCFLFPLFEEHISHFFEETKHLHLGEIMMQSASFVKEILLSAFHHFPRRISSEINYVMSTQFQLTPLTGRKYSPLKLFRMKEFPLPLRLLKVRAILNPELQEVYIRWREQYRQYLRQYERHGFSPRHRHTGQQHVHTN